MSFTDHVEAHWTRPYRLPIGFPDQLCDREFSCLVDGREQVQLSCTTLDFDNIDEKKADGVALDYVRLSLEIGAY